MKVKEMMYWLGKLDPEQEVMCQGDGGHLYSNVIICNKPSVGKVWMLGAEDNVMQIIDMQLKEVHGRDIIDMQLKEVHGRDRQGDAHEQN